LALFIGGLAMTSLVAGLATTVFGVYHFHRVSPYALAANLLAMPAVSILVMPMAVAAVALMPFGLDGWALDVMAAGIRIMNGVALWFSERTPIDAVGLIPVAALVALTVALVLATLLTSRMRLLAVPVALIGFAMIAERRLPDVLVSEDGRLVALTMANGELAANHERPNGFTFENWMRSVAARDWIRPVETQASVSDPGQDGGFVCRDKLCVARGEGGALVVHAPDAAEASAFCPEAALIVIDDATARNPCAAGEAAVLTKRDLARRGSASIYLDQGAAPRVVQAIGEPFRPWHDHRRYSRAARGLPPWRKEDQE
jgi:competence protein ComEC